MLKTFATSSLLMLTFAFYFTLLVRRASSSSIYSLASASAASTASPLPQLLHLLHHLLLTSYTSLPSDCFAQIKSESSKYSARLGCIHGEEIPYLFGAPIAAQMVSGFSSFPSNYSKPETFLSHSVINYFSNFAKFG